VELTHDKRALDTILAMFLSTTVIVHTHEFMIMPRLIKIDSNN
jgi:hypothetical protein